MSVMSKILFNYNPLVALSISFNEINKIEYICFLHLIFFLINFHLLKWFPSIFLFFPILEKFIGVFAIFMCANHISLLSTEIYIIQLNRL